MTTSRPSKRFVRFKDGTLGMFVLNLYPGPCLVGDPTAYVLRDGKYVWVKPDGEGGFVETDG